MSRNDLFLLLACGIAVAVLTGTPSPLARSPLAPIASLISPSTMDEAAIDPTLFQRSFDHQ